MTVSDYPGPRRPAASSTSWRCLRVSPLDAKGDPDPSLAIIGEVASFMSEHPGRIASRYLVAIAAVLLLLFAAGLRARIRRQEGGDDTLSSVVWGAGLLTVGLMLVGNSAWLAADFHAVEGSGAADLTLLWALGLAPGILGTISSAMLLAAAAIASLRLGVLPRTLGYAAGVIAVGLLVGSVEPQGTSFLSPLWGFSYMFFQLWVLVTAIALSRRRGWEPVNMRMRTLNQGQALATGSTSP